MSDRPQRPVKRLASLDAYRGFIMLAMVSSGFAISRTLNDHTSLLDRYDGTQFESSWKFIWQSLDYQFSHVFWTGCGFWDLIQLAFMFMVGVSMPFSYSRRASRGDPWWQMLLHALFRSAILIVLGVFLSSNWQNQTNFTFVNVLTQIGLGYPFLFLLLGRKWWLQLFAIGMILGGYWYYFYQYDIPEEERDLLYEYVQSEVYPNDSKAAEKEFNQFDGIGAHWNKHTNAAAEFDRCLLNQFVREEDPWNGRRFWINNGGYQTLNFVPSIATMIFGLMAGQLLWGTHDPKKAFIKLTAAGGLCFIAAMSVDTTIWPIQIDGLDWTFCPAVKRIWTPTWAVFSAGWSFWMLAAFYGVMDVWNLKAWAFPLKVVGMNSIVMYVMAQLLKPWFSKTLDIHLTMVDQAFGTNITWYLFSGSYPYARILESLARLLVLWLTCLWLYRRKLFVRI